MLLALSLALAIQQESRWRDAGKTTNLSHVICYECDADAPCRCRAILTSVVWDTTSAQSTKERCGQPSCRVNAIILGFGLSLKAC